jgi:hypothetical protein
MLAQLQDTLASQPFADRAIRDTIAQIAKDAAYQRALGHSLWDRVVRFVIDQLGRLFEVVSTVQYGRTIVVILVILAVGVVLARLAIGISAERKAGSANDGASVLSRRAVQLADAERLASSGEYTAAAHMLFAVVLAAGSARGEFRVHPSKTLGDYAREMRRRATGWQYPFSAFRNRFDRVVYGDGACSAEDYHGLLTDVQAMLASDRAA